jgi:hypothetical protein
MMKNIFLIILLVIIIASCEKSTINDIDDLLILEGYLFQNEKVDSIHLVKSLPFATEDTVYTPVDDAQVSLFWNDQQYSLINIGNGYYSYFGDDLFIEEESIYTIEINFNGQIITSETKVPKKASVHPLAETIILLDTISVFGPPQFTGTEEDSFEIVWDNPDNSYYYVVIESADSTAGDIIMGNDDFSDFFGNRLSGMFRFRSEPFIGDRYVINTRMLEKYGIHKVKVYSVNEEYANLYENRTQDSRTLSEPITNVNNGLGIFTAFSYSEVSFLVKNKYRDK